MTVIYTLTYYECDLKNHAFHFTCDGPTIFFSKNDALKQLLLIVKSKLKDLFGTLTSYEENTELVHFADDFENTFMYAINRGEEKMQQLLNLYFNNASRCGFLSHYKISRSTIHVDYIDDDNNINHRTINHC